MLLVFFGCQNAKVYRIFKKSNISLHHCYEDSLFREQAIRLAENNFRKK